jgi:hypothetical protein
VYERNDMIGFSKVMICRVDADGGLPDSGPTQINQGTNFVFDPRVVELGGVFWLLFFDRFDTSQTDPYLSAFDSSLNPVLDHVQLLATPNTDESDGLLVARGDHLLAGWLVDGATLQLARLPLDGGAAFDLLQIPETTAVAWSWAADAGVVARVNVADAGNALELDRVTEEMDGGLTWRALWSQTVDPVIDLSIGHLSDEQVAVVFSVNDDAGNERAYVLEQSISMTDTGEPDAASPDAGSRDGGAPDSRPVNLSVRCGCESAAGWTLLLLPVLLARRRVAVTRSRRAPGVANDRPAMDPTSVAALRTGQLPR